MGNSSSNVLKERLKKREELGYPPIGEYEEHTIPQKNLKSISFKYGKYPGVIALGVGGVYMELDLTKENLLHNVGGRLLLERCHCAAYLFDSLGILKPSDFTFEYFADDEMIPDEPQIAVDGREIVYKGGLIGMPWGT